MNNLFLLFIEIVIPSIEGRAIACWQMAQMKCGIISWFETFSEIYKNKYELFWHSELDKPRFVNGQSFDTLRKDFKLTK